MISERSAPGVASISFCKSAVTARVRLSDAAGGNCTAAKKYPWSSGGTKPPGTFCISATAAPIRIPSTSSTSTLQRIARATPAPYRSVIALNTVLKPLKKRPSRPGFA